MTTPTAEEQRAALAALFTKSDAATSLRDLRAEHAKKGIVLLERAARYGWGWVQVEGVLGTFGRADELRPALGRYLVTFKSETRDERYTVWLAPDWLSVLVEAYGRFISGSSGATLTMRAAFVSMVVSWCAAGGKDALEGRAKPLAAILGLAKNRIAGEQAVNIFINEVGF